jgi:hypothetical protein
MLFDASIFVHTKDYMDPKICTVRPPLYVEPLVSISVLEFFLGMRALSLRNGLFLSAKKFFLTLSQNE